MPSDFLARYDTTVPEIGDDVPEAWHAYLRDQPSMGRRIAKALIDLYDGNAAKAARLLDVSASVVHRHLQAPAVRLMLGERKPQLLPEFAIADREERSQVLTDVLRDSRRDVKDRLKALELLGKMSADYTDKVEVKGQITTLHELVRSLVEEPAPKVKLDLTPSTEVYPSPAAPVEQQVRIEKQEDDAWLQ